MTPRTPERGFKVDTSFFVLLGLVLLCAGIALHRDAGLLGEALAAAARTFKATWADLLFGFLLAGLLEVLVPKEVLLSWLNARGGVFTAWACGMLLPGGPYVVFPLAGNLFRSGVPAAPLITLISAKLLVSPVRTLAYEVPLLGWRVTLARLVPSLLLPPLLGWVGAWLLRLGSSAAAR